jgi:outer membrane lipoprotein SlyB
MEQNAKLHPLLAIAAVSVTVFSFAGIGAVTGLLPFSAANKAATSIQIAPSTPTAATIDLVNAAASDIQQIPAPTPESKPVVKKTRAATHKPVQISDATAAATVPPPPPVPSLPAQVPVAAPVAAAPALLVAAPKPVCLDCGTVENFRQIEVKGDGSPLGVVAGGATGALIGHQFGRGSGKDLLTIAGAVGGAFAGHEIEKNVRKKTRYEISVRMDDGSVKTLSQDAAPAWRIGEHVRVINNQIVAPT